MEEVRAYILSVTAAAILCAIVSTLAGKGGSLGSLMKLMTGVVLSMVIISPLAKISVGNLDRYLDDLNLSATSAVEAGTVATQEAISNRIKAGVEAYILDKAAQLSLDVTVEVTLTEDGTMVPAAVVLEGAVSPYAKSRMETILKDDLGIPVEAQTWR